MIYATLTLCVVAVCLTALARQKMRLAAEKEKRIADWKPCGGGCNRIAPISAQVFGQPNFLIPHTVILVLCKNCGGHFSRILQGGWTMEQLLKPEADEAQLARMMGAGN